MTFAIDPLTNDLVVNKSGTLQIVTGEQEVKQRILIALFELYGEYFLNTTNGVPFYSGTTASGQTYEGLLGSKNLSLVEAILRMVILGVPNVLSIASLQLTYPNHPSRKVLLQAQVEVQGASGPTIISIVTELTPSPGA
jgi:hypothetical protein